MAIRKNIWLKAKKNKNKNKKYKKELYMAVW